MSNIIIGCDPDSCKSGVAIYVDGNLSGLKSMSLIEFMDLLNEMDAKHGAESIELHIENVNGISSNAFNVTGKDSLAVKLKKAEHVGKCKQAQIEIERIAEFFRIKVLHHRVSKHWKKEKSVFERATGWSGRSNEDTRSAAYFGFVGCKK